MWLACHLCILHRVGQSTGPCGTSFLVFKVLLLLSPRTLKYLVSGMVGNKHKYFLNLMILACLYMSSPYYAVRCKTNEDSARISFLHSYPNSMFGVRDKACSFVLRCFLEPARSFGI